MSFLKLSRRLLALLVFIPLALFFLDFAGIMPPWVHHFAEIQFVPALLAGSFLVLLVLLLLTWLFGRIYCSVICPMGILQDLTALLSRRGKKRGNKKRRWYSYSKPRNLLRYSLLTICAIFLIAGITAPTLLLDPYSNFGRIFVNLFRPIAMEGNNLISHIALRFNSYTFYPVTLHTATILSVSFSVVVLLFVVLFSLLRGRLLCNTVCPVGALLSFVSRYSLFRIRIDHSQCTSCRLCERSCKAECIDSKEKRVDASRCVGCFNCLEKCSKQKAISYSFSLRNLTSLKNEKGIKEENRKVNAVTEYDVDKSRRSFLALTTSIAAGAPFIPAIARPRDVDVTKLTPITPPGSISLKHFKEKCTACHLCITRCPQQILKPAGLKFGINYLFKPHMVFYEKGFCNYECTICSEICPNKAILPLSIEEKKWTQVGIARFERDLCIVITDGTSCGACSEHCPVQAVRMEPYKGGLTLPQVYEDLCIGCGGCESICPVRPVKAINVLANETHRLAELPPEEESKEIDTEELDWGF